MSQSAAVWLVIVAALVAANLPFINNRVLAVVPLARTKTLPMRLAELVLLYLAVGGLGLAFERSAGQVTPQGWEFFAVTGALFVTFAIPRFVWRYLLRRRR
jgi:hypothetical protein